MSLAVVLGLTLLGMGVPRTFAAWAAFEADLIYGDRTGKKPRSEALLAETIAHQREAVAWQPSAGRLIVLGILESEFAQALTPGSDAQTVLFERAERHLREGLLLNPVDAHAWMHLAWLRARRGEQPREIMLPVLQSLDMAPHMRGIWIFRAAFFMTHWPALHGEEIQAALSQLRTIWREAPEMRESLLAVASGSRQESFLRWALTDELGALDELDKLKAQRAPAPRR